jgi:uncharacterized protein
MAEYLHPGVFVEEIDAGPQPIEGVSTSTAGAVGVTERGPTDGKPLLVTSFADFQRNFGGFLPVPDDAGLVNRWSLDPVDGGRWWQFPLAVKGFFDNGGQRLYVKRVVSAKATAASTSAGLGVVAELDADAAATDKTVRVRHLLGAAQGMAVDLVRDGSKLAGPYKIASYDSSSLTLDVAIGFELKRGRDLVVLAAVDAAKKTLTFSARAKGGSGNDLQVRVRPMVGATLKFLPQPAAPVVSTTLAADALKDDAAISVAAIAGFGDKDHLLVNGVEYTVNGAPAAGKISLVPKVGWETTLAVGAVVYPKGATVVRLRPSVVGGAGKTAALSGASGLYPGAMVELDSGTAKELHLVDTVAGEVVTFKANVAGSYWEGHRARLVEAEVGVRYAPGGVVQAQELFQNLHLADNDSTSYLPRTLELASGLVRAAVGADFKADALTAFPTTAVPAAQAGGWLGLDTGTAGDDKLGDLSVDDFVGVDGGSGQRTGIQALEDITEISLVAAPGIWSQTVQSALIQHCEQLRYRFAVIDPPDGLSIQGVRDFRAPIDTKYAALYYPYIEVRDPAARRNVVVAPSLPLLGLYARVDVDRGVHKAPANEVIRGVTRIAQDVNQREQDMLNPGGINALRFFPGRGNRVWGARTLSSESAWKYVNVRRIFIFVEASIDRGTQWVVFEPNDEPLWARVRATITNFLTTVWRSGALQGTTPAEAFFVKCDRTTMTQDDIDNGRLICAIGIAPVKPAEFVIFRIQQKTLESTPS